MSETENNETGGIFSCNGMSWIIGALLGIAAFLIVKVRMEMSAIIGLVIGIVVLVVAALIIRKIFCGEIESAASTASAAPMAAAKSTENLAGASKAADAGTQSATITSTAETSAAKEAEAKKAAEAAAKAEVAMKEAEAAVEKAEAAAQKVADDAAAKAAADAAEAAKSAKPAKAAKPARKPVAADGRPEALDGPRDGTADDLKQIKGVGPKMEDLLNSLGFYHFDQVAGWRAKEVKWVDENLKGFKGRVSRDEWVKQAKVLAKGGVTEFSKKVKKGGVY